MSKLTQSYADYYDDPTEDAASRLLSDVKSYDFADFAGEIKKLSELNKRAAKKPASFAHPQEDTLMPTIKTGTSTLTHISPTSSNIHGLGTAQFGLRSNGSSGGTPTTYELLPHRNMILDSIESYLRQPAKNNIRANEADRAAIVKAYESYGPMTITATPAQYLHPTTSREVSAWLSENSRMIEKVINTNWEPFFKNVPGIHVNDQMMDWKSGLSFYTCAAGKKHILPTWGEVDGSRVNLLNMAFPRFETSDHFVAKKFEPCVCGGTSCDFDFVPHVANSVVGPGGRFYDPGLADRLAGTYHGLQFFQDENTGVVSVYISPEETPPAEDLDMIRDTLTNLGLEFRFVFGRSFVVGTAKLPNFWRGDPAKIREVGRKKRMHL